jgi:hypothetical protein
MSRSYAFGWFDKESIPAFDWDGWCNAQDRLLAARAKSLC